MKIKISSIVLIFIFIHSAFAISLSKTEIEETKDKSLLQKFIKEASPNEEDDKELFLLGLAYHNLSFIEENLETSKKAVEIITEALEVYNEKNGKDNAEYLMYLGSAYTMIGRDAKRIAQKVSNVNKGLAMMDEAIDISPNDIDLRIIRASNNVELPEMFARIIKIEEDLVIIEKLQKNNEYKDILQNLYYLLSKIESDKISKDDRKNWLQKAYDFNPNSVMAKRIQKEL